MHTSDKALSPVVLIIGFLLVASTLRAPITGIAPIIDQLQTALALSAVQAGLLTTLPLLAFGVISPLAPKIARHYGLEPTIFGAMLLIILGILLRSVGWTATLYMGTGLIGAGIAVGNVLLPSLAKRDFPQRVPTIMGLCSITMGGAAAVASATVVPLQGIWGWQVALASALIFPLLTAIVWVRQLKNHTPPVTGNAQPNTQQKPIWRYALAWQVTLFMGTNSLLYYIFVAWLPSILTTAHISANTAGSIHGVMQLATALPGLFLGPIMGKMKDQKLIAASFALLMLVSLLGFNFYPHLSMLWAFGFGFGSGGDVLLALIFMSLRTPDIHKAASLSGMAQSIGYFLAACGPIMVGKLHEISSGWSMILYLRAALAVVMLVFGLLAGRNQTLPA